jgi:hypothetical protein
MSTRTKSFENRYETLGKVVRHLVISQNVSLLVSVFVCVRPCLHSNMHIALLQESDRTYLRRDLNPYPGSDVEVVKVQPNE